MLILHSTAVLGNVSTTAPPPYNGVSAKNPRISITFFPPCASNVTKDRQSQFQVTLPSAAKNSYILTMSSGLLKVLGRRGAPGLPSEAFDLTQ
ncbi:hypothetical protein BDV28DRAFT_140526 [Aspergillus coremiiformis]|uniref:Uncharacterized protein n=1 Tax=Aspergillus coremiiformis TaxID=138285 RepID=A0A5N6YYN1_9EURO|nr:hypothetical protein BDV28DRAFT_140526 [Aspergillus coremiiformis]